MRILLLSREDIQRLLSMQEAIRITEDVFRSKALGRIQMPPKSYIFLEHYKGDFRIMPAYLEDLDIAGVKIVNSHPSNPEKYGLPTVMATMLLLDPRTGAPIAIMDGSWITSMRTGAAGAVAAKYLAREDSKIVALIGTGVQARAQLSGLIQVLEIEELRLMDIVQERMQDFANEIRGSGIQVRIFQRAEQAVRGADVVVSTTPSRQPIIMDDWISPGMHLNAIGADAPGKQELDPMILKRAKIVVDDYEQAMHGGEINVPISKGILKRQDIYAELGEILIGEKPGRTSPEEITVFDSTGLAIQDVATAWLVYEKAREEGVGLSLEL